MSKSVQDILCYCKLGTMTTEGCSQINLEDKVLQESSGVNTTEMRD
jgi:hypothetical protein